MKKIMLACSIFLIFCTGIQAQILKELFKGPEDYTNKFIYFYLRPVDIDTGKIKNDKTYELEGSFKEGDAAIAYVEGAVLKEILRLDWPSSIKQKSGFPGKGFTCNYLGKESFLTKKEIDGGKFDPIQKETLYRDRNKKKFQIRSALPIEVKGEITDEEKIKVCENCL